MIPTARRCLPVILASGICGCAPPIHVVQDFRATFLCDGNRTVQVQFAMGQAVLDAGGEVVTLTQLTGDGASQDSDSFLYRGDVQSVAQHGFDADWTDGTGAVHHCRRDVSPNPSR